MHNPLHVILWERYEPPTREDVAELFRLIAHAQRLENTIRLLRERELGFMVVTEVEMDRRLLDYLYSREEPISDFEINLKIYGLLPPEAAKLRLARLEKLGIIRRCPDPEDPEAYEVQLAQEHYLEDAHE